MSGKMRADTQKSARIGANLSIVSLQISAEPGSHLHQFGFIYLDVAIHVALLVFVAKIELF